MDKLLFVGLVMSISGCAQSTFDYYYISLENSEDIEVISRAKLELKNLKKNSEIPVEYIANREKYSLSFIIGNQSYSPHLRISVSGLGSSAFTLIPRRNMEIVSGEGNICGSYYLGSDRPFVIDFGWSIGCLSEDIKKEISFDVIDQFGNIVANEDIPFKVKGDGKYTLLDAI